MKPLIAKMLMWCTTSTLLLLMLWGCGGENDAGGGGMNPPPPATMVVLNGFVHTGTPSSPIANAACRLVARDGTQVAQVVADGGGLFRLLILPELQGFIQCTPPGLDQLLLSTFISTVGQVGGDVIPATGREEVSPQTTVIAALLVQEAPANPQARKEQLLAAVAAQEPDLTALITATNVLYQQLIAAGINATFDDSLSSEAGDGGSDASDGGGGVSGDVGDGAELSPIPEAHCSFSLELEGDVLVSTVLHDLFVNGRVTRTDLQPIAAAVNQALAGRAAAIVEAFTRLFPNGLGQPLEVIADGSASPTPGHYFLPVPAALRGFVRCFPPNQDNLVLTTWVRPHQAEETLLAQDVTPLTTLASLLIAAQTGDTVDELIDLQENFFDDSAGLRVGVTLENGTLTGFEAIDAETVRAPRVGLAAFAATALYNVFFFNNVNATFLDALRNLVDEGEVDSTRLAEDPILSPTQAATVATLVNTSTTQASEVFGTDLDVALDTARLVVRVRSRNNATLPGATVTVLNAAAPLRCENCPATTAADGTVTLNLTGVPRNAPIAVTVVVRREDFVTANITVNLIALARAVRTIELVSRDNTGTIGGTVD